MAKKIIEVYTCDICGKKTDKEDYKERIVDVVFHTEQTEGFPVQPYRDRNTIGFCEKCFDNYTRGLTVHGWGAQGYNDYKLK